MKSDILSEKLYCPAEKAVLLASYAVQAKFNDYDDEICEPRYLANEKLFAPKILSQHKLSEEEWEEKVKIDFKIFSFAVWDKLQMSKNVFSKFFNVRTKASDKGFR